MVAGKYLRTNYRRTGGALDITGLGGNIWNASVQGGAGVTDANWNGGLMYFMSYAATVNADAAGDTFSNTYAESAYGLMSYFYGSTIASGYRFQPLGVNVWYVSDVSYTMGASTPFRVMARYSYTDSIMIMKFLWLSEPAVGAATTSQVAGAFRCASGHAFIADIWGLIVSAP